MFASRTSLRASDIAVRAAIVALALATGYIHSTLGGLLFTLNAVGYAVAAIAIVVPLALAVRFRWIIRVGLMGYAATAILVWAIQGPYFHDRLHRQGHRGRPHRRRSPSTSPATTATRSRSSAASSPPSRASSPAAAPPPPAPSHRPTRPRQESPT